MVAPGKPLLHGSVAAGVQHCACIVAVAVCALSVHDLRHMLQVIVTGHELSSDVDLAKVADRTEGYSGSDLKQLCTAAAMRPVRELLKATSKAKSASETKHAKRSAGDKRHSSSLLVNANGKHSKGQTPHAQGDSTQSKAMNQPAEADSCHNSTECQHHANVSTVQSPEKQEAVNASTQKASSSPNTQSSAGEEDSEVAAGLQQPEQVDSVTPFNSTTLAGNSVQSDGQQHAARRAETACTHTVAEQPPAKSVTQSTTETTGNGQQGSDSDQAVSLQSTGRATPDMQDTTSDADSGSSSTTDRSKSSDVHTAEQLGSVRPSSTANGRSVPLTSPDTNNHRLQLASPEGAGAVSKMDAVEWMLQDAKKMAGETSSHVSMSELHPCMFASAPAACRTC